MTIHFLQGSSFGRAGSLGAILLSLILGILGVVLLLLILGTVAVVSAPPRENTVDTLRYETSASAAVPAMPTVRITKTVDPPNSDTGGTVSICFTIKRPGLDVVLVQDVSGSMDDPAEEGGTQTRLEASQVAANTLVSHLQSTDRGAVVPYSTTAYLAQPLTTTKSEITGTIEDLVAGGYTNIGDGIKEGHEELINPERYMSETVKAMVLLSDGNANRPEGTAEEDALREAEAAAADDIKIYTIGFGDDANTKLLETIAMTTSGEYYFAPDSGVLETVYLTIALKLHNIVITDILIPGVETECSQWPEYLCIEDSRGVTTVTLPISDSLLMSTPVALCFTATVNLTPKYEGPINDPSSGFCYQNGDGQTICPPFINPTVTIGGRKITGYVFRDSYCDGFRSEDEEGLVSVTVKTSTGLTVTTDVSGHYVLSTSSVPALSVTIDSPPGYLTTSPISRYIPAAAGTYTVDLGICRTVYVPIVMRASLHLSTKTVDKPVADAGETLRHTITLRNSGTTEAVSAVVTDTIPTSSTYIVGSVTGGGWFQNGHIHWSGSLGPGKTHVIEFETRIDDRICASMITNEVIIADGVGNPLSRLATTQVPCVNGGFESGWTCWIHGGELNRSISSDNPHSGKSSALLGDPAYRCRNGVPEGRAWMERIVLVPYTASPKLFFWYNIFTHDKNSDLGDKYDSFDVKINGVRVFRDANTTDPYGCNLPPKNLGWRTREITLSAYSGRSITVRFENWNRYDHWYNSWTYVDDVQIIP